MNDQKIALPAERGAFYLFDPDRALERVRLLRRHLPPNTAVCYAVKANPFLCGALAGHVERFEACSPGELRICSAAGIPAEKTVISGVYKTPSVTENAVKESGEQLYTVESLSQFSLLKSISERRQKSLRILLRLSNDSQFGIDRETLFSLIESRERSPQLYFIGIQYFSGTQKTSLKKLAREVSMLDALLDELCIRFGYRAPELEYGTGFPVCNFTDDTLDEEAFLQDFCALLSGMRNHPRLTIELGRSIVADCGRYYTHVADLKQNNGQNYIITDGGMHHIVYYGQHMAMRHPFVRVVGKENIPAKTAYTVCGALCSMNDILAKQMMLPDVATGDLLCFENAGAYCMTEGISLFLSRALPAVYLLQNGKPVLVRRAIETAPFNTAVPLI